MIESTKVILAEDVCLDSTTNRISAFNLIESISTNTIPSIIPKIAFICFWERKPEDVASIHGIFTVSLNDEKILSHSVIVDFNENLMNRSIYRLNGIMIKKPGKMTFSVILENKASAKTEINIIVADGVDKSHAS